MRWAVLAGVALFIAMPTPAFCAHVAHPARKKAAAPIPNHSAFFVAGLEFTMPPKWVAVPPETPARAGQWKIPVPRGSSGDPGEVVAFFFGPGRGGNAKSTIAEWVAAMPGAENHSAPAGTTRQANGKNITQVILFGTYSQAVPMAGMPPISKPDYGLIGTVVENSQGNVYWRITGPRALINANLSLCNQMIDSVRSEAK